MSMKRILYMMLAVCLTALAAPCSAMANGGAGGGVATPGAASVKMGDFTVTGGRADTDFRYADHTLYIMTGTPITVSGVTGQDRIYVESGVNADITLTAVRIQVPDAGRVPPLRIADGSKGKVKITLADGSAQIAQAALTVPAGATLVVSSGASFTVPDGAVLTVAEGAVLTIEKNASLAVMGKVRVDGVIRMAGQLSGTDVRYRLTVKNGEASGDIDGGYVRAGERITLVPQKPASAGLYFAGWECVPADLTITGNQFLMPAATVSAEARYGQTEYTVSFDLNGGSADKTIAPQKVPFGGKAVCPEAVLTPPSGKCRLDGWYTADGHKWDFAQEVKASMTLTARWAEHGELKIRNRRSPDCTSDGYTGDEVCSVCGMVVKAGSRLSRWGHSYGNWEYDRSGHWQVCYDCGERGRYGEHRFTSWVSSDGWQYDRCEKCGYQVMSAAKSTVGAGSGTSAGPPGVGAGSVPGTQPGSSAGVVTGVSPGAQTEGSTGVVSASKPQSGGATGTGSGTAQSRKPGAASMPDSSAFWSQSDGSDSGSKDGESKQKPSEEDQQKVSETDISSDEEPTAITRPSGEDLSEGSGQFDPTEPSDENGSAFAQPGEDDSAEETLGGAILQRIPWWFWIIAFFGIAAAIIVFAVVSMREEAKYYDDEEIP